MARKRKQSDDVYNARRRLKRAIDRAKSSLHKAVSTTEIEKQKVLISELNRNLDKVGRTAKDLYGGKIELSEAKERLKKASTRYIGAGSRKARRERTAKNIMSTSIGSRIIGAFEPLWNAEGEIRSAEEVIFERVGVESWGELLEKFEGEFPELYKEPMNDEYYDKVKMQIMLAYV